jgi:hypothetical protein
MHKIRAHALACAVALLCCGRGAPGDSYVVLVDPAFSPDEREMVIEAISSWEAAVPVHLSARIAECAGIHDGTICTHASTSDQIAAMHATDGVGLGVTLRDSADGGEVFIDVATVEAQYKGDFQRIVAHEIGHAMHLDHGPAGNLMAALVADDAPTPTCADAAAWYEARSEQQPPCP